MLTGVHVPHVVEGIIVVSQEKRNRAMLWAYPVLNERCCDAEGSLPTNGVTKAVAEPRHSNETNPTVTMMLLREGKASSSMTTSSGCPVPASSRVHKNLGFASPKAKYN